MLRRRLILGLAAFFALASAGATRAYAQGVTTGSVTGTVTDEAGRPIEGAQVQLRNPSTGLNVGTTTRSTGLYFIQGIEPGLNYVVNVRRIGYAPATRTGVRITLSQTSREDFRLEPQATVLEQVRVSGTIDPVINASKTGTGTTISDSALSRMPTLNRNFSDFVQAVPQVSTTTGYLSGGGVNLRQNAIQIDGAQAGDLFGLGTTGQPGSQANAKSIPLDAVKEYQVLLSPFDIRQGNFGGLLINAVTKSGTNEFHGSVYGYARDQALTRSQPYLNEYKQQNYGLALGGPILKDKLFFFVNGEFQSYQTPASGPWIGSTDPVSPIDQSQIDAFNQILSTTYGFDGGGTGAKVNKKNPTRNVFARIDARLPYNTRLVLRHNYASADNTSFGRSNPRTTTAPNFNLTSNSYDFSNKSNSSVAELLTNLPNGMFNEVLVNYTTINDFRTVPVKFPMITVQGIQRSDTTLSNARIVAGTENSSQGNKLDQKTFEVTENFTVPVGRHSFTLGGKTIIYKPTNLFGQNSMGNWTFSSLANFQNGIASNYQVSAPSPSDPRKGIAVFQANQYSLYVQDQWTVTPTLTFTGGLRWDKPDFRDIPPENPSVFNEYERHTSSVPTRAQLSPRFGFNWDVTGDQVNQLRGGIGAFAGSVPFVYLSNAFGNSGLSGYASLTCNGNTSGTFSQAVPQFNAAAIDNPPTSCAPSGTKAGATIQAGSAINTIDPSFRFPKYLKGTLGYDRRVGWGTVATIEGLYTRSLKNAFYQNLALVGPQGRDRNGRTLYGTFSASGATPTTRGSRTQVLDVTNSSGDYTYSLTGQIQKSFSNSFEGSLAYTYQQARDVGSVTSSTAGSNYRYQRDVSGDILSKAVSKSKYDQPHRIVATATYSFKTKTDVSFIYTGNSGAPYDYVYGSNGGSTGDLNADGQSQNDLVYVPKNALDQSEILFQNYNSTNPALVAASQAQARAFESFINSIPCLRENRGRIMGRNACRNPWINEIDVSFAQSLSPIRMQNVQLRLDIINFGNLLNKNWGAQAFSDQGSTCGQICSATVLLTHVGNRLPNAADVYPQGIFTFDPNLAAFNDRNASSNYRMQLSLRYSF